VVALSNHTMKLRQILFASALAANALAAGSLRAESPAPTALPPASVPAPPIQPAVDDDGPPRLSLPTDSDRAVWKKPGFRFGLGLAYGRLFGINGPRMPSSSDRPFAPAFVLDERWSLMGSFQYLYATGTAGTRGLRYAGTIEPTWHASEHLNLGVGIGFGGLVGPISNRPDPKPLGDTLRFLLHLP